LIDEGTRSSKPKTQLVFVLLNKIALRDQKLPKHSFFLETSESFTHASVGQNNPTTKFAKSRSTDDVASQNFLFV